MIICYFVLARRVCLFVHLSTTPPADVSRWSDHDLTLAASVIHGESQSRAASPINLGANLTLAWQFHNSITDAVSIRREQRGPGPMQSKPSGPLSRSHSQTVKSLAGICSSVAMVSCGFIGPRSLALAESVLFAIRKVGKVGHLAT